MLLLKDGLESRGVVVIGLDNRWCVKTVTGLDIRCVEDVMKLPLGECVSRLGDGDDEKLRGLPAMFRVEVSYRDVVTVIGLIRGLTRIWFIKEILRKSEDGKI